MHYKRRQSSCNLKMALQLSEVTSEEEFSVIAPMLYAAFHDPFNPFYEFYNNTHGTYEEQVQAKARRHATAWAANPAQHWLKITDSSNNNVVVAAASWLIYKSPPGLLPWNGPFDATWHPAGSVIRAFTTQWMGAIQDLQSHTSNKPHLGKLEPLTSNLGS